MGCDTGAGTNLEVLEFLCWKINICRQDWWRAVRPGLTTFRLVGDGPITESALHGTAGATCAPYNAMYMTATVVTVTCCSDIVPEGEAGTAES
jgi:hypothetical protein